jgi:uncharacterized beta-barrel protein YwiB (DUF1934 family)
MTKGVLLTITGLQADSGENPVSICAPAVYHLKDGKHFLQYEERSEEQKAPSENTLKISPNEVVLTRKGPKRSQMIFDLRGTTRCDHETPYGSFALEIKTKSIEIEEATDKIIIRLEYSLLTNEDLLSENKLSITIEEKK